MLPPLAIRKSTQKRRGVSQIIGSLLMLSIVVVIGTAILLPGLSAIEDFRNVMLVEDEKNDSSKESLIIEHVYFAPTSQAVTLYVRNTGSTSAIVDSMTVVKIDTQDLLLNVNGINDEIFVKEVSEITRSAILGGSNWEDSPYSDKSYEISVTTVRGNSFKVVAIPYNTWTPLELKDDLLEKAITNAKSKAEKALAPLDYSVVGVKNVSLSEFGIPYTQPILRGNFAVAESTVMPTSTPVFSSDQDVTISVQVVFLIGSN